MNVSCSSHSHHVGRKLYRVCRTSKTVRTSDGPFQADLGLAENLKRRKVTNKDS